MSNKRKKKKNTSKKVAKNNTISMLKLDNDVEIPAKTIFMKDSNYFNINDIDINKIRVSNSRVFMKKKIHTSTTYSMKMGTNTFL